MKTKAKHLILTAIGSALGVLLLIVLLRASPLQVRATEADSVNAQPAIETGALGVTDWQTIVLDTYDGTYTSTYRVPREITHTGSADYEWGRVLTSSTDLTDTLWCVGGAQGSILDPDTGTYTDGVTTTVTYGPMSFQSALTAELSFSYWISLASGDDVEWGYSTDGYTFTYSTFSPTASTWDTKTFNSETDATLASLLGERTVYVSFRFHSDGDEQVDRGVFLDDVQVRTRYTATTYFPIIYKGEPVRFDDFSDEDPVWEQYYVKDDPKDGEFFHQGGRLFARVWDNSGWVVASPSWRPLGDFRLEVDARFVDDTYGNYVNTLGLVFGGEIVQDVRGNWTFAEFYEFVLAYNKAQHLWAVRRRDADWSVHDLDDFDGVPSFVGWYDHWNHLVVLRILDKIHVYCNGRRMPGQPSEGYTDSTYGTNRMVGVSIGSWELDRGEMEFDNFLLTPLSMPY